MPGAFSPAPAYCIIRDNGHRTICLTGKQPSGRSFTFIMKILDGNIDLVAADEVANLVNYCVEQYGVSRATVYRYINELKDELNI